MIINVIANSSFSCSIEELAEAMYASVVTESSIQLDKTKVDESQAKYVLPIYGWKLVQDEVDSVLERMAANYADLDTLLGGEYVINMRMNLSSGVSLGSGPMSNGMRARGMGMKFITSRPMRCMNRPAQPLFEGDTDGDC